jgi:hypothetical protein
MFGGSLAELLLQLAHHLESVGSVILGLVCIAYGAAMIINPRRHAPEPQLKSRRSVSR